MGNRLTKIYTRTGDDGTTGLGDGSRIQKDSLRVEAMGQVDHLNSHIGTVLASGGLTEQITEYLTDVQHDLFDLGAELCVPGMDRIHAGHVERIENRLDELNADLDRLRDFVLPGGTFAAANAHLARTACRNAERAVLALHHQDGNLEEPLRQYLNRLSDFLFVVARQLNRSSGTPDVIWIQRKGA